MKERTLFLNELSQGLRPLHEGLSWFNMLPVADQREVIRDLAAFILQAKATQDEVARSLAMSGLKLTVTPAVLLSHGLLRDQLAKVGNLPENEMEKSFRILIALLSVSDERRRRTECVNGCKHPWHNLNVHL